ncbi:subclass B3 metallo-beta-lactamase [Pedobacter sp. ASV12]|uniref:subclass B3 metallo-beta-lactamase n=1 Tax=Pedobacter sp. ASV12 TaxID=2795120 RepID=UPI0018EC69E8|nr:subclass B3 metallo-beta-lactamase [Pedobacter sp. ASV12]
MFKNSFKTALLAIALLLAGLYVTAQQVHEPTGGDPDWSKPYQPFQIVGNLYYVGTYDLACYLITTPKGHILINTGLASSANQLKANVEALGFKFADIKILLTTQAHFDHLGAMAAIKKMTGANMMVDDKDAAVMADGGRSDYAFGNGKMTFAPIKADKLLPDQAVIELGGMRLTLLHHPGHTKGSCSFLFNVKDKTRTYHVLIANMPSIVTEKKFSEVKAYPGIAKDYAYTLNSLKNQAFDIWLSSHASQFNLHGKHKPGDAYNPKAFIDRKGYDQTLAELQEAYNKKLRQR